MTYGKVLDKTLGECGSTQVLILCSFFMTHFLPPWTMVMMGLIAGPPKWWSVGQYTNTTSNTTYFIRKEQVCPNGNETVVFDKNIYTIINEAECLAISPSGASEVFKPFVLYWKLICDKKWIPPVLITTQMFGVLVGCATAGHLGDMIGRKKTILIAYLTMLVFLLVQAFSMNWHMMAGSLFCVGIGAGGTLASIGYLSTGMVFLMEFVSPKWRTIAGAIPIWGVAIMVLGVLFKILPNWRHLCIAMISIGSVLITPLWFLPESVRWLLTKGKTDEAKIILHRLNKRTNYEFEDNLEIEDLQLDAKKEKNRDRFMNYFTLFRLKDTRYKTLILGFLWVYCSFSYYGLTLGVGNLQGDLAVNLFLMGLSDAVAGLVIWLAAKILQRRNSTIFVFAVTAATSFSITISYEANAPNYETIKYGFALVARFFLSSSFASTVIFTVELFPTEIRSLAFSFTNFMARIGGIASAQNQTLSNIADHLPFTLCGSFAIVSAILCLFLKDTYSEDLPDYLGEETELLTENDSD